MKVLLLALCVLVMAVPSLAQQTTLPLTATPDATYNLTGRFMNLNRGTLQTADSGTCTTQGACLILILGPTDTIANITSAGTFTGTVQIEGTLGNGVWVSLTCPTLSQGAGVSSFTAPGAWQCSVIGLTHIRLRMSAWTVGSAVVAMTSTPAGASSSGNVGITGQPISIVGPTDLPCYINGGVGTTNAVASANCKSSAAIFKGVRAINTSGSIVFVRMYNLATVPTCTSSTGFQESIAIPANTSGAGEIDVLSNFSYSLGLGYCITLNGTSTDNTAPTAGVFITISYD